MEHRWGERLKVDSPVRVTTQPFIVRHGRILDLSVSGAYIETDFDVRVLSLIKLSIMATHWSKHEAKEIEGYVVRKYRQGVGIEWTEFAPAEVTALLRTVSQRPLAYIQKAASGGGLSLNRSGSLLKHGT